MYFEEHLKPSKIAAQVRMGTREVQHIIDNLKRSAKRIYRKMESVVRPGVPSNSKLTLDEQVIATFNSLDESERMNKRTAKANRKGIKCNNPELLQEM